MIEAALHDEMRPQPICRNGRQRVEGQHPLTQIWKEEIRWRGGGDATCVLHRLVLGEKLERLRRRAADEFVKKYSEPPTGAVDEQARRGKL